MDLTVIRENAIKATTEDLLDRVTVYRAGMETAALEVLEQVLRSRGVTDEQVRAHAEERGRDVMWESPGLACICAFCNRPAVGLSWQWQRILWGTLPVFPRQMRCCREHLE